MTDSAPAMQPQVQKENGWAMSCHLLSFLGLLSNAIPFVGSLVPAAAVLFVWFLKKDTDPQVNQHGRHSLNWQLTVFVVMILTVFPILGMITYQAKQESAAFDRSSVEYKEKLANAKNPDERAKILEDRGTELAAAGTKGDPRSYVLLTGLMAVLVILIVITYFVYVVRNAIRAFREQDAIYPFAVPLFAVNGRRGLIK